MPNRINCMEISSVLDKTVGGEVMSLIGFEPCFLT